jgi:hypothetical protein
MKCGACGYKKGYDWVNNEHIEINLKGKDFIRIDGSFTVTGNASWDVKHVDLCACPECKTIILDDSF